ncbi:hypothetical protein C8R41DRAFT_819231 [Lentinula lateritia]|uniref:SEC7 domain-containing protein n=1 Tax=Lentinula lateritia TaxID=40482 RepID=A0ABQ8VR42_9AGAR|nr:hypothetical protein C8R41DRAFT_819231 [Lentinula lateritia]
MDHEPASASDQREQRMLAVAKLKRAASLPRLKDGRRPPMHNEAVSEGEKGPLGEEQQPDEDTPPPQQKEQQPEEQSEARAGTESENEVGPDNLVEGAPVPTPATRNKRRSRSRSRSRGSRDMKGKARAPTPSPLITGDSSQDEAFTASPTITLPVVPQLISPVPSQFQRSLLLRSPTPTSQDPSQYQYPGTSPPTPLPSLEALQKGLFRSNSAGRMLAMHKLTNGTESYEPSLSPSPALSPGKFKRTNTVSGGERNAARKLLMDTLGSRSRVAKDTDGSGNDEIQAPSPSPNPKRRRRRSRRGSSGANTGISDSEFASTSPNTPIVPPTPLPPTPLDLFRARSVTPNQLPSPRALSPALSKAESPQPPLIFNESRRRSVVVEEEDEEISALSRRLPSSPTRKLPSPPASFLSRMPNTPELTDYPTTSGVGVPVYLNHRDDIFPNSPFSRPLKEKTSQDDDEEEIVYNTDTSKDLYAFDAIEREISWIASPVPEIRRPIYDNDDDDEDDGDYPDEDEAPYDERPPSTHSRSSNEEVYEDISPRVSSDSQNVLIESDSMPDVTPLYAPPSPSSVAALSPASMPRESDGSLSPQYHNRPSPRLQGELSPMSAEFGDLDDRPIVNDNSSKRSGDSTSTSAWEKVKSTFTRSNSVTGRRSRSNSIVTRERRDHTDSSISRESGASINSPRGDPNGGFASQQSQAPVLSPSTSALSLAPQSISRVSPVPPPTSDTYARYQNAKLFPFPGIHKLEEERNRVKGLTPSASTPDINAQFYAYEDPTSPSYPGPAGSSNQFDQSKDRTLMQQTSESNITKYLLSPPLSSDASSSSTFPEYFDITPASSTPTNTNSIKLPMTLPAVKQWMSKNKKIFSSPSQVSPASLPTSPNGEYRNGQQGFKKPSLSDLLRIRKDTELVSDWEDLNSTSTETGTLADRPPVSSERSLSGEQVPAATPPRASPVGISEHDVEKTPKAQRTITSPTSNVERLNLSSSAQSSALPSPPDPLSSTTPDPSSSLSDYPAPSTSTSSSSLSSNYSVAAPPGAQGSIVLERLEENLARGPRSPMWASVLESPPRKLILSSPVLQVVNANTVKDRFLFLFSDILVIAKPVAEGENEGMDLPTPERKFTVKSVVSLQNLRFNADRADPVNRNSTFGLPNRNPLLRSFIHQFSKDPDHAISTFFAKSGLSDDPVFLGQLLFRTTELDRATLGRYLSQRTSKVVLKSYVDSFGFVSSQVNMALRAFLMSLHVPSQPVNHHSALEYLLDAFASRWYEANARFVDYDKDLAIRLVRAIIQLNDLLHGGISDTAGLGGFPRQNISSNDFVNAFRRYDPRSLVADSLLENIYKSIWEERLSQAKAPGDNADILITIKRPLPTRITYKVQSDPIIIRIPQTDPQLSIHLFGQGLTFEPSVLTFSRSSEASFRVTGNSLGSKTVIICRSGPNALKYSGLPLGHNVNIERAFMRNTFQVAFLDHCGAKRRYMFSVDDPLIRHQWTVSLKKHVGETTTSSVTSMSSSSSPSSRFYRAAELVAFKVLQEALIGKNALRGTNSSEFDDSVLQSPSPSGVRGLRLGPSHVRSKSRSQVYLHTKAGKNELDISNANGDLNRGFFDGRESPLPNNAQPVTPVWTGRDLEIHCLQNSSITLVLSYLQVGAPKHVSGSFS